MRLPRIPKGLKARISKEERKAAKVKAVSDRKKLIASMRKKLETLKAKNNRLK